MMENQYWIDLISILLEYVIYDIIIIYSVSLK